MIELKPGTQVTKAVRLLRPLGQGGMGKVWVAEHLGLHTDVVVKFMATDTADKTDAAERFTREAAAAAAVKSPHVVQTFDHGLTEDGVPYIVMELLEGRDLAAYLEKNGRMAPADVAAIVAQVAKALGKAHQVGIVHRDIKPENVFLCDGEGGELFVKVLDFGIAKHDHRATAKTTTGQVFGTPFYMSPEQIVGERDIDARTDIWSLGVVAFEAMTGKRPFQGETIGAVTLAIHTTAPVPSSVVPEIPKAVDAWFAKACAREPQARFASVREAANALLEAVGAATGGALVRAPMLSMVREGSDPAIQIAPRPEPDRSSEPREGAATSLSSTFAAPRERKPSPIVLGASIVAVAVLAVGGLFALRSGGAPERAKTDVPAAAGSTTTEVSSAAAPSAVPSAVASASPEPSASAAPTASTAAVAAKPVAAPAKPASRPTGGTPTATTPKPRPRKPTDDDIK